MKRGLKPIVNKMNELFITERKKYIIQNKDGSYNWLAVDKGNKFLHDYMIESHLKRQKTYGIFSGAVLTKFITFDVDILSHEIVYAIYNELYEIGINSNFIYTSWSGSKGYHIDIYFSEPIAISYINKLYNYVTHKLQTNFPDMDIQKIIELRPSPTKGVKLPLGINRKNKNSNSNVCWFVDINNSFKPIKEIEYILEIEQIEKVTITEIINKLPIIDPLQNTKTFQTKENVKQSHSETEYTYSNYTVQSLEKLDKQGLTRKGTRNESLCKLAIYYKALGATKSQCRNKLIHWMNKQDTRYYKTPLEVCYEEIERIVHGVYSKNIPLKYGKTEIEIYRNELLSLHYFGKLARNTLYFMFIHSKRYGDENGEFFMTYNQLMEAGNYSKTTAINHVKILEEAGAVQVTRSPTYFENSEPWNLPNKYKLNLDIGLIDNEQNTSVIKSVRTLREYSRVGEAAMLELFPNFEWFRIDKIIVTLLAQNNK